MAIAGFGSRPPIINSPKKGFRKRDFERLKHYYFSLPKPILKLFSFNTRVVQCCPSDRINLMGYMFYTGPKEKPTVEIGWLISDRLAMYDIYLHELGHTLDPNLITGYSMPKNYFPAWLHPETIEQEWLAILKEECKTTELAEGIFPFSKSKDKSSYEAWACRLALTLMADFMVPAKLVSEDNLSMKREISIEDFKSGWPKSYEFFHWYVNLLLSHAPKN